ncbi:hypothetical protein RBG61_13320 [Paludicola sp. MB14-C6]|uniref:hypothetical protein n=1 Tax=Paludihabitans sp. MB14-C6 TaxID=3070656 RepID=UPI0027DB26F3|nr:hypothetical protein [Paludicola sp. MB14-C6]WMJ22953.1 hypothetical protein RBG61_13320 [Paludicola sp. MB14-C6]
MEQNIEFLTKIYQNAKMGEESIDPIINRTTNERLRQDLITQKQGYVSLGKKAKTEIMRSNEKPKDLSPMTKYATKSMVKINTMMNHTPTHIAKMMIQGSTMGIIDAQECLHKYSSAQSCVKDLANEVLTFEQNNIERLKTYL